MTPLTRGPAEMKTIEVRLNTTSYPVYLGRGLLGEAGLWGQHLGRGKVLVVSNDTVAPLYLDALRQGLEGRDCELHIIPDGEQYKTVETWYGIVDRLVGMRARRDSTLVAPKIRFSCCDPDAMSLSMPSSTAPSSAGTSLSADRGWGWLCDRLRKLMEGVQVAESSGNRHGVTQHIRRCVEDL